MLFRHPSSVVLGAFDHRRTRARFESTIKMMNVDSNVAEQARLRLIDGSVVALVVSGPQASGKDTVGPAVLASAGAGEHVRIGVADGLKQEMSDLLLLLSSLHDRHQAAQAVSVLLEVTVEHAGVLVDLLWDETRPSGNGLTGWSRTGSVRRALQYLGHEARQGSDPLRYVRMAVPRIVESLASGVSVYMGDGRFPREAEPCRELGMFLVRLHVEPEVKAARLLARDGIIADPKALHHAGEHALDDWDGVDLRVDNSHATRSDVVSVVSGALALHRARLATDLM